MPEVQAIKPESNGGTDESWHIVSTEGGCIRAPARLDGGQLQRIDASWPNWKIKETLVGDDDADLCPECFPFQTVEG